LDEVRLRGAGEGSRVIAVHDLWVRASQQDVVLGLSRLSGLGCAGALLSSKISLGEALFPGLGFPIVIPNSSTVANNTASKLSEHGPGSDNGDLSRAIRERKNLLLDQIILFGLGCNHLEEGPVLVEQKVRVSVAQHPCALGGKHE
jgi:hypothetical protein